MPWGDDDSKGLKWIRVIATLVTLILNSTMFGFGIYPKTYYWFIGQEIQIASKVATAFIICDVGPRMHPPVIRDALEDHAVLQFMPGEHGVGQRVCPRNTRAA